MEIVITTFRGANIAEIISDVRVIHHAQDALDLLANCRYQGAENIIIKEEHLVSEFFDLKTGIAGDILQKFSTYRVRLAIVGDFAKFSSKSLRDFIFESNKTGRILFVSSTEEARMLLATHSQT